MSNALPMNSPELIRDILTSAKTIAVVGLSDNAAKPSYSVSAYLQAHGYRILPVNPGVETVLGEKSYASLAGLPEKPDVVDVFRLAKFVPEIVDEVIRLGIKNLWLQLGVVDAEAAARAEAAGIRVVMDRCMLIEHRRLGLER
ncbi:MAG: CoA-binding protein [Acidobacteriaceae bacterium]